MFFFLCRNKEADYLDILLIMCIAERKTLNILVAKNISYYIKRNEYTFRGENSRQMIFASLLRRGLP